MRTVLIGYDLNRPVQLYADLIEEIKNLGDAWWHHLDSTWIVRTTLSVEQIRNRLAQKIDANDELLVIAAPRNAAWIGFNEEGSKWLKNYLKD